MAGAPYGNRNAEKWTFKKAVMFFDEAIEFAVLNEKGIFKYDFIGEVARDMGSYKSIFSDLVNKFPVLSRKRNRLIETLEANCFWNAKKGNIKEASAIMNLKSNHKWTDRRDITSDDEKLQPPAITFE